jgi:response regulator RpfG family c-di-GMP phosphodiesterase
LCVDDEVRVVESLALTLRRNYQVHIALSGDEGLKKLSELRGVAVVIADMRMPGMNGATFLKRVMRLHPETSRILLTGDPGRDAGISAVNEAQIFRYLTKPCPPEQLQAAIEAGVDQFRLYNAERSVLQETLIGCIEVLVDVLAITNPVAFGRANRVKRLTTGLAEKLGTGAFWQLDAAAMLSQIGFLSLPVELVDKLYYGEKLTPEERLLTDAVPEVANRLLGHIPRLEPVLQILSASTASDNALRMLGQGTIGTGARILGAVLEYDTLITQGHSADLAMRTVRNRAERYGEVLVEAMGNLVGAAPGKSELRSMPLRLVQPGMVVMDDIRTHLGTLLVPKGFEVNAAFLERLNNFGSGILAEKVRVMVPAGK